MDFTPVQPYLPSSQDWIVFSVAVFMAIVFFFMLLAFAKKVALFILSVILYPIKYVAKKIDRFFNPYNF